MTREEEVVAKRINELSVGAAAGNASTASLCPEHTLDAVLVSDPATLGH